MNRKEFTRRVATIMRERNIRKPVIMPKQVFHITDDEGNKKDFAIRKTDKKVLFSVEDIETIIDVCLEVVRESLKRGEEISFRGFGVLGVQYRKPRVLKHVETQEETVAEARYVPKFYYGSELRMAAKLYGLSLEDQNLNAPLPVFNEEEGD